LGRLDTFLVFVQEQLVGMIGHSLTAPGMATAWVIPTWQMSELLSEEHWNCVVVGKIPELPHANCAEDGILMMTKVNHLTTL